MTTRSTTHPSQGATVRTVLLLACLLWTAFWFQHAWHYWEDDAYIHLEYARSLFEGRGFMFNGLVSNGDTSPVWVLLLVGSHFLVPDWLMAGKALTVLSTVLALWAAWAFVGRLSRDAQTDVGATQGVMLGLFVLSPYFCYWAFAGMEAVGAAGLLMAVSMLLVPERPRAATFFTAAFLMGLGPLVRPEMILLVAAGGPFLLRQWWLLTRDKGGAQKALWFLAAAVLLALPLALWSVYALQAFGYIMPNTNAAKRAMPGQSVPTRLLSVYALGFPGVLAALGLLAVLWVLTPLRAAAKGLGAAGGWARRFASSFPMVSWPLLLWAGITLLFYIVNHTYVQTRYVTVMAPGLLFVLLLSLRQLARPWAYQATVALTAAMGLAASALMAYPHVRNKAQGDLLVNEFAAYVRQNVPANAGIAVYSIGQLGFLLKNPLIDIGGITRPEATHFMFYEPEGMLPWAKKEGALYYISGDQPEPGATLVHEVMIPNVGWYPKLSEYDIARPTKLWKLAGTP